MNDPAIDDTPARGPLDGIRVLDLSRLAPGPFCSMVLGDLGADVLVVEPPAGERVRPGASAGNPEAARQAAYNALRRNKRSIVLNLKDDGARGVFMCLARDSDVVLEGFRPGVVDRLGVGYEAVKAVNPEIVYCSLSGYGQDGPYVDRVGHDINYIAVAGALGLFGLPGTPPTPPLNLLADFAGGGLHAAMAIVSALLARERGAGGQYIDIAMSDGVLYLMASVISQALSRGAPKRGEDLLTNGIPYYNVYETADGRWLAIGSLEPHFFANLCTALGCEELIPHQNDPAQRERLFETFRAHFREHPLDRWMDLLTKSDVCVAPVYTLDEALVDAQNRHRQMRIEVDDSQIGAVPQVGIGPKFSATPGSVRSLGQTAGKDTDEVLAGLGFGHEEVAELRRRGAVT